MLHDKRFDEAAFYFTMSCKASRIHIRMSGKAGEKYGFHGAAISGVVRDHFPNNVKRRLRCLARAITEYSNKAYAAKPKGVHRSTMLKLGRAIAARYGSGYYGIPYNLENSSSI